MTISKIFAQSAALFIMGGSISLVSCSDKNVEIPIDPLHNVKSNEDGKRVTSEEIYLANQFASEILSSYYYWNEQIEKDLSKLDPNTNQDPISTVSEIKYHEGDKVIDKWTSLIKNMSHFKEGVSGINTTYGFQPVSYLLKDDSNECVSAIAYVYKNSPAARAGLKRGDIIYKINGENLTTENLSSLFESSQITLSLAKLDVSKGERVITPTGKNVQLVAIQMYEDPILLDSIYEVNNKKVGYLAYSSFDLNSIPRLIDISKKFKARGVKELILDLRYNGGGYVITENVMASMYAPQQVVETQKVFEKEIFNKKMTELNKKDESNGETLFKTDYKFKDSNGKLINISTKDANVGIEKVYGLISKNSASASEALLGGLMPYMDVELIGQPSHGKYCTGWMISAEDAYKKVPEPIKDWGIYVMVSVYQNAAGKTPCMPDGLQPDVKAADDPLFPTLLGDVNEAMLKVALMRAGKKYEKTATRSGEMTNTMQMVEGMHNAFFGKRILIPEEKFMNNNKLD